MNVSTEKSRLDIDMIYRFLHHEAYWSKGRPLSTVERSIEHSLCFGLYQGTQQIGFARVVTDYAIFAWLMDVFVLPEFRAQGGGKLLLKAIFNHPELQTINTWGLKTHDAHSLYGQFGFSALESPEIHMEYRRK